MNVQQFNAVLLAISNDMKTENLDKMKFLVRDRIGKRELENITTGHRLFQSLTERGLLGADKTEYLAHLLEQINRTDLLDKLNNFTSRAEPVLDEKEKAKLQIATEVISENLGKSWRKLGRKLRISDVKLESISQKHPADLEETTVELLKEWRKIRGAEARAEELIQALRACQYNMTADKLERKLKDEGY